MLNQPDSYSGKCDGCAGEGVPIMKLSLGRDFFGRVYDRLSPSADVSPKWYCDTCSMGKNLQRDFRDIQQELKKLHAGEGSVLQQSEQLQRAILRLKEIAALLQSPHANESFVKSADVSTLLESLHHHQAASAR